MNEALVAALVSAIAIVAASAITIYLTKRKEREAAWREKQLEYYEEFFAAISGIVGEGPPLAARLRFSNAVNNLNLIASQDVIRALRDYCDETATSNRSKFSMERHDMLFSTLTYKIRRDLKIPARDDFRTFSARLWHSGE